MTAVDLGKVLIHIQILALSKGFSIDHPWGGRIINRSQQQQQLEYNRGISMETGAKNNK